MAIEGIKGSPILEGVAPATAVAPRDSGSPTTSPAQKPFSEVWQEIQAKYGGREEKPREIKKKMDKDDFLKIMVTQLQHQDPTKPVEADKMATEMAQITSVEQMHNINEALTRMTNQYKTNDRLAMSGMIGRFVTVDRNRFPHDESQKETLSFRLKDNAQSVKISIISEAGETVLEKELGPQKAGENSFLWDGKKTNTLAAKAGNYVYRIDARGAGNQPLTSETLVRARVLGINFEGSEPALLVGDQNRQDKVSMKAVVRIDSEPAPAASGVAGAPTSSGQYFTFEKGVGSKPLDLAATTPEVKAAIDKAVKPTGFPSGLTDPEQQKGGEEK